MAETIIALNPVTQSKIAEFVVDDRTAVEEKIARAEQAFLSWRNLSVQQRGKYFLKVRELIYNEFDVIADLISASTGKPKIEAYNAEIIPILNLIPYFVKRAPKILADQKIRIHLFLHKKSVLHFEPYGVVGILSPWNYPFAIPMGEMVQALLAGNAVVLKVSEAVLPVAKMIGNLFEKAAFPTDLIQVLYGAGETGAALVQSPRIKKICFTGSTAVGQKILEQAAKNLTPTLLELGGKDAAIVFGDANIDKAACGIVWGAFTNAGQTCAAVERVYVDRKIAQPFIEAVIRETEQLTLKKEIGAITLPSQLGRYEAHLQDALEKGAKILVGGRKMGSSFFEPTVLINVNHEMRVMQEETFGPLLPIMMVDSPPDALQKVNDSCYGLTASIWSENKKGALSFAKRIEAGTVTINDCVFTHALAETPWGGTKKTGGGRVHSDIGLREYVQIKHINWDRLSLRPFWWFPYTERTYQLSRLLIDGIGAPRISKRIWALLTFLLKVLKTDSSAGSPDRSPRDSTH